jgi:serine/threonine protein kinase
MIMPDHYRSPVSPDEFEALSTELPAPADDPRPAPTSAATHPTADTHAPQPLGGSGAPAAPPAAIPATVLPPAQPAALHPLPPGTRVGPYEVVERIGKGGMGVVYRARHREIPRVAALKMMLQDRETAAHNLARFRKDAGSLDQIRHDNIVRLYEYDVDPTHGPYFALELVEGGSLASQIRPKSPWEFRRAARLVETLARAADFAHRNNIVHRDLKPGNVLLAPRTGGAGRDSELDFVPKITDFGLAKSCAVPGGAATVAPEDPHLTCEGVIVGTPSYMAPEQALGRLDVDHRVDVYALGAILYELLTGRPPFVGNTSYEVLAQVQNYLRTPPPPVHELRPDVPKDLEDICLKCLKHDPSDRYGSAAGLADALASLRDAAPAADVSRPPSPTPGPPRDGPVRLVRRHPVRAAIAALVAILLCGGAYLAYDAVSTAWLEREAEAAVVRAGEAAKKQDRRGAAVAFAAARSGYRRLADSHPGRPAYRIKVAELLNREGKFLCDLRDWVNAERAVEEALAELEKLPAQSETSDSGPDRRLQEAEANHFLGVIYNNRDDDTPGGYQKLKDNWAKARKYFNTSKKDRIALEVEYRGDAKHLPQIRRDLARSYGYLGDTLLNLGEYSLAWTEYQEAENIRQELAEQASNDLEAQMQLARSYANTGYYYRRQGRLDAVEPFRKAREYLGARMGQYRSSPNPPSDFILDYASYCLLAAELLSDRPPSEPDQEDGLGLLEEAKKIYEPDVKDHPDDPSLVSGLAQTYLLLAKYHRLTDPAKALADLKRADDLLASLPRLGPDDRASQALVLALRSQLTEDAEDKKYLVRRADELLKQAHDAGYNNLGRLKNDPGFQMLHQARCPEYDAVVRALEAETKP